MYYYKVDDYIEAFKWFRIIMTGGEDLGEKEKAAENILKELTSKMTGAQIAEAMRRKTEWVKSNG